MNHRDDQLSLLVCSIRELGSPEETAFKNGLLGNPGIERVDISRIEDKASILFNPALIREDQVRAALGQPDFLVPGLAAAGQRLLARHGLTIRLAGSTLFFAGSVFAALAVPDAGAGLIALLLGGMFLFSLPAFVRCMAGLFRRGQVSPELMVWVIAAAALGMGRWIESSCVIFLSVFADALRLKTFQPSRFAGAHEERLLARRVTLREGESTREISLSEIQKDQVVVVHQGQMAPVDGMVVSGKAEVRDAALTGESTYQTRTEGQSILAGTIVESGSLDIRVVRAGKETLMASIDRLVNRALSHTGKANRFMDRFIKGYLFAVVILAVLVFALFGQHTFWSSDASPGASLRITLNVLLAACPIALVLAGPLTLYAGLLRAARHGVLFKGGDILEKLAAVRVLLLDKTGTLTYAQPKVSRLKAFRGFTEKQVLEAALFVERQSSHPIARAICEYAEGHGDLTVQGPDKFHEFEGGGACAVKGDYYIKVGALWLMEDGRELDDQVADWMAEVKGLGLSFVLVANRTRVLGGFILEDAIRENAGEVMTRLRQAGIHRLVMVTGDQARTAERVREAVGLDQAEAECMPDKKLVLIQNEKRQGHAVGMVGDGINDAPALAAADVGIAMGTHSSDLAVEAADVALINNDLQDLYLAVAISHGTSRFLRISAITAVTGNLLLVALSAFGIITTMVGGVLLQVVLLAVVALLAAALYVKPAV